MKKSFILLDLSFVSLPDYTLDNCGFEDAPTGYIFGIIIRRTAQWG